MKLIDVLTKQEYKKINGLREQLCLAKTRSDIDHFSKEINQILDNAEQRYRDPNTRRLYELKQKTLSDENSRLEDAKITGMLTVARSLLNSGMSIHEIANHTPYTTEELNRLLKKY